MTINKLAGFVGSITVLIGALFAVENRYAHAEDTKQKIAATKAELQVEILREKLARLNAKAEKGKLSQDDEDERTFTRALIAKLQEEALRK